MSFDIKTTFRGGGLLYPIQNQVRNVLDTSGLWQFQLDLQEEGEAQGWFKALAASRLIAVPCSWNDLFDDVRDYLGLAWYRHEVYVPYGWRGQRVFLRVGSANYKAKVWVNGTVVAQHLGAGVHPSIATTKEARYCSDYSMKNQKTSLKNKFMFWK